MSLRRFWAPVCASLLFSFSMSGWAQGRIARLPVTIDDTSRVVLPGSRPRQLSAAQDTGVLSATTKMNGVTLVFNRSPAQEADLQTLLAAQANPASPLYHHWLTPDQFAARFGMADADLATAEDWLQTHGFSIDNVGRGRDRITFTGTAGQVNDAFGAVLHQYKIGTETHFGPSGELTVPAALAPAIAGVLHLSNFRPKPPVRRLPSATAKPTFTQGGATQTHYLTPGDIATQYDVNSVYSQGFNGAGQSIAVIGQSYIQTSDIQHFQTAAGITANLPSLVLVPNTGLAGIDGQGEGDEGESDLDVEYSSAMARGANIFLVYVGDNPANSVADSATYAITEGIAPVISVSYGVCETDTFSGVIIPAALAEQATAQGQTIVAASGDSGSTGCFGNTDVSATEQGSLTVQNPANLANVTGVGGLQMAAGTYAAGNTTYFSSTGSSDKVSSLLSYVPEVVWNEDSSSYGLLAGGGGVSAFVGRPTYQANVPGLPAGTNRLVPDISLQASAGSPGYLLCSSDPFLGGSSSSCASGFEDSATGDLDVVGGTSFAAPILAGLVAVLNQATHANGLGNINTELYALASNPTTYASAFHDITSGSNACAAGPTYCIAAGEAGYSATAGYDLATGLGSIDFANLVKAWPVVTGTGAVAQSATTVALSAAATALAAGATDTISITVAQTAVGTSSGTTPTGTVEVVVDGAVANATLPLTNGKATYTFPGSAIVGSQVVLVIYSGDVNYLGSSSSVSLTVGNILPTGTFTLSAAAVTIPANGTGSVPVSVVPGSGYSGVVTVSLTGATSSSSTAICYAPSFISAGGSGVASGTLFIGVGSACTSGDARAGNANMRVIKVAGRAQAGNGTPVAPGRRWPAEIAVAGLLMAGCLFRKRFRPVVLAAGLLSVIGLGLSGCGSNNTAVVTPIAPISTGTYTLTITGNDTITSSISATTTFTLTVQ